MFLKRQPYSTYTKIHSFTVRTMTKLLRDFILKRNIPIIAIRPPVKQMFHL